MEYTDYFTGDEAKTAALGTTPAKLKIDDKGVEKFCKLVGFPHQYTLYRRPDEMPKGVKLWSELEGQ